jgi:hypothetical protein
VLVLSAYAFAFMPVDVVLEIASTLPTPVLAVLLTWLVAFCAEALRLALLEVADPRAAHDSTEEQEIKQQQTDREAAVIARPLL